MYRHLTDADFFNMYKPPGAEKRGGGQTYVDFLSMRQVDLADWRAFLADVLGVKQDRVTAGPRWRFPVRSIGVGGEPQTVVAYQRRSQTICLANQRLGSRHSNRIHAWSPERGFPAPQDPTDRHQCPPGLVIFLIRTASRDIWAGWLSHGRWPYTTELDSDLAATLGPLIGRGTHQGDSGALQVQGKLVLGEGAQKMGARASPLRPRRELTAKQLEGALLAEDTVHAKTLDNRTKMSVSRVRRRNQRAVSLLKQLYHHVCQVTGEKYVFRKRTGANYVEAHHLIPLGSGGADSPHNMIIVSAHIHRMLHYAAAAGIDLNRIVYASDGSATMQFSMNRAPFTVRWHPLHAKTVLDAVARKAK
jgi:5-methylcytosine-specific restriction protein A